MINASQVSFFETGQPFTVDAVNGKVSMTLGAALSIVASTLNVADLGITAAKIATGTITHDKIAAGTIRNSNIDFTNLTGSDIPFSNTDPTVIAAALNSVVRADGTVALTATWDVGSNIIRGLATPVNDTDAVNKETALEYVSEGIYNRAPTHLNQLRATHVRACVGFYMSVLPLVGTTFTIHGVTFTFVAGAPASAQEIQIGGSIAATLGNCVTQLTACVTLTSEGIAFNTNFETVTWDQYLIAIDLDNDPPNTPADGNSYTATTGTSNLTLAWGFRGGILFTAASSGTITYALDQAALYKYVYGSGWSTV